MSTVVESSERTVNGVAFPSAGTWALDPAHTSVEFQVKHLMVAKVKGHFAGAQGALAIAEDPEASGAEIVIDATTISTGAADRDSHLRSPDFLEVEAYPEITFVATAFAHAGGSDWELRGDLTIHGVTRPVTLATEYQGVTTDPWGGTRAVFSAETAVDREDWGLTWNQALETGGWLVGKDIRISIEVEAVRQEG